MVNLLVLLSIDKLRKLLSLFDIEDIIVINLLVLLLEDIINLLILEVLNLLVLLLEEMIEIFVK